MRRRSESRFNDEKLGNSVNEMCGPVWMSLSSPPGVADCRSHRRSRFRAIKKKSGKKMASALSLCFSTTFLFLITALFARNGQAKISKESINSCQAVELELGEQPWLALLEIPDGVHCTGTIVSPTSILSAALCLKSVKNPEHGIAYAGNIKYTELKDFEPWTQNRSIVQYHLYDENNTQTYNLMLVKINLEWTWSESVQPIGIIEKERLPKYITMLCDVSGLGYGSHTEEDSKVARSVDIWTGNWRVCSDSPQEHRMCAFYHDMCAPCVGDFGGSVVCYSEPQNRLYGIISEIGDSGLEEQLDHCEFPAHDAGFQFVGFYAHWIKKTAGDLPSAKEVKAVREQHERDFLHVNGLFRRTGRNKRSSDADNPEDLPNVEGGASKESNGRGEDAADATDANGAEAVLVAPRRGAVLLSLLAAGAAGVLG